MPTYRCIFQDLRTGTRIAELAVNGLRYGSRLNDCGDLSGFVPMPAVTSTANKVLAAQINDALDEGRREIIVERDGVPVWVGIVWIAPYTDDPPQREVRAAETWSYFRHRFITTNVTRTAADQCDIAQDLITDAINAQGGNIGVTVELSTSGVLVTQAYASYELKPVAEAVEALAKVDPGFDFAIDPSYNPSTGALVKTFRTQYPRRGRRSQQTGHVFEVGRNVISWSWPSDGTRMANKVWAVGRGEGSAMLLTSSADTSQITPISSGGPGYPLLEQTISATDVAVRSQLNALALARRKAVVTPVTLPEITVRADIDPVFGSYITGDSCRFIIPPDTTPRFPNGLDTFFRIVGWDVSVSDDGAESVTLTLGNEFDG